MSPRVPLLGSKPVFSDRCCDEMIDKRVPLPWVEAQDQPCRDSTKNENGALVAKLSSPHPHKATKTTTTSSRNLTVICPHLGKKFDTHNKSFCTKSTPKTIASDRIHKSEATTERSGLAPRSASLRESVQLTIVAARRTDSLQTYKAFGCIRPLKLSRGNRPTTTKKMKLRKN
jgi:hypothetical protein